MRRQIKPFMLALSLLAAATLPVQAADLTKVEVGKTVEVDAHNTCKEVTNKSNAPIMVPHGSKAEWTSGDSSFLQNVARMPSITVADCGLIPSVTNTKLIYCESKCFLLGIFWSAHIIWSEDEGIKVFETRGVEIPWHLAADSLPETWRIEDATSNDVDRGTILSHASSKGIKEAKMAFGFCKAQKVPGYYAILGKDETLFGVHCVKR